MRKKDKELLLRDLCARLPYGVKVKTPNDDDVYTLLSLNPNKGIAVIGMPFNDVFAISKVKVEDIKPYLRPMDSMTKEEEEVWLWKKSDGEWGFDEKDFDENVDWLNAHHFDHRKIYDKKEKTWKSMIEMKLALPSPNGMYNFNKKNDARR